MLGTPAAGVLALTAVTALTAAAALTALTAAAATAFTAAAATAVGRPSVARPPVASATRVPGAREACVQPSRPLVEQCQLLVGTVRPRIRQGMQSAVSRGVVTEPLTPADLRSAYGRTQAARTGGMGETVAVVDAFGDPYVASDLARYRKLAGLGECSGGDCFTILNQDGGSEPLPSAAGVGWADETALDVEMVAAICPNCRIVLLEAKSSSLADLGTAVNSAARVARFISISWTGTDFPGESRYDTMYFDHPGVAIAVASGDFRYGTGYPASSQLVTSVGGTYLYTDGSARGWSEVAWNGQSTGAGTGTQSGCSSGEPKPAWQSDPGCANRTENDVAAVADAPGGVEFYSSAIECGGTCQAFGTSVATPVIAAVYALAGTPRAGTFPVQYPYLDPAGLHHVTSGSNGTCEASRRYLCDDAYSLADGYNGPDGMGTPDGTAAFTAPATRAMVSLINPGSYDLTAGLAYHLPAIRASDSDTGPTARPESLTFSATGLPAGMSISPSTAVISGTPAASDATVKVTVQDEAGAGSAITFRIAAVRSPLGSYHGAPGEVRLDLAQMCLDERGGQTGKGNPVQVWRCTGDRAQRWEFQPGAMPGGTGELMLDGRCLDIEGQATRAGSVAGLWPCTGEANQQWLITGDAGELYNPASRMCLNDPGGARDGLQVDIDSCSRTRQESWTLPASPITSGMTGKCADDFGGSHANGDRVAIYSCDGTAGQRFTLGLDGTIQIGGKCLNITGSSGNDGTPVQLWSCDGAANEIFRVSSFGMLHNPGLRQVPR